MVKTFAPNGIPGNYFYVDGDYKVAVLIDTNNSFNNSFNRDNFDKVLFIHGCEPPTLLGNINESIIKNKHKFDIILSYDENIVNICENAKNFAFGSSWVLFNMEGNPCQMRKDYYNHFNLDKKFKLSFIKSNKNNLPGQKLRHQIGDILKGNGKYEVHVPKKRIPTKKELFIDSMYHITIENSRFNNYFSEKIVDCFMSYTVPIYWGCPNIGDYFNMDGIIIVNDKNELKQVLNNLSPSFYKKNLKAIKENYELAYNKYGFFFDNINDEIKNICI